MGIGSSRQKSTTPAGSQAKQSVAVRGASNDMKQTAPAGTICPDESWLRECPKTGPTNIPPFNVRSLLSDAASIQRAEKAAEQAVKEWQSVVQTATIDDSKIRSWGHNTSLMESAMTNFLFIQSASAHDRRVEVGFVPFGQIDNDVHSWSYRWATPVTKSELLEIDVYLFDAGNPGHSSTKLYSTTLFQMELEMVESDIRSLKKVWIDKICVPQKSIYTGPQISAMGFLYQKSKSVLREVRDPDSLPMFDYLSRAWTYQESRYGRTLVDRAPPLQAAKSWAEMLFGKAFVSGISGLLYRIPNIMARSMDNKVGTNNITFFAMRECIGSGKFFTFFVANYRKHDCFPASDAKSSHLAFLETIARQQGAQLDALLADAHFNAPRKPNGSNTPPTVIGPFDCRQDGALLGHLWRAVVQTRSEQCLEVNASCAVEMMCEMSTRSATFQPDRFIGSWAVLLNHLGIPIVKNAEGYPDAPLTWLELTRAFEGGLLRDPGLSFMLYGPNDMAGMQDPGQHLPAGILNQTSCGFVDLAGCERVVAGVGDGTVDTGAVQANFSNAWAVHVAADGAVSLLMRAFSLPGARVAWRRVAVVGRRLHAQRPDMFSAFLGLLQADMHKLLDMDATIKALGVDSNFVLNGCGAVAGLFREYLISLTAGGREHAALYRKTVHAKYNKWHAGKADREFDFTPLRELVYMHDKMSGDKAKRSWTAFETLQVCVMPGTRGE